MDYLCMPCSYFWGRTSENPQNANFHEKALFVKADVAASCGRALELRVLRAMLPSALSVNPLFRDSVHYEILLFGLIEDAAIFGSVSLPRGGRTKFVLRSRLISRSEAIGHTGAIRLSLEGLCRDHHLLPFFFGFASSFRLLGLQKSAGCCAGARRLPH
jgi:hypothetical protein